MARNLASGLQADVFTACYTRLRPQKTRRPSLRAEKRANWADPTAPASSYKVQVPCVPLNYFGNTVFRAGELELTCLSTLASVGRCTAAAGAQRIGPLSLIAGPAAQTREQVVRGADTPAYHPFPPAHWSYLRRARSICVCANSRNALMSPSISSLSSVVAWRA